MYGIECGIRKVIRRAMAVKTLGPSSAEILLRLSAAGKTIFRIADAQSITGADYKATAALLDQLARKNGWCAWLLGSTSSCRWKQAWKAFPWPTASSLPVKY